MSNLSEQVKNVIEATVLPIIQEQQVKIERLEKQITVMASEQQVNQQLWNAYQINHSAKIDMLQLQIEQLMGSKMVLPKQDVRAAARHQTANPAIQTPAKPDAAQLKNQQKKLEENKQKHDKAEQKQPQIQDNKLSKSANLKNSAISTIKKLPDPKQIIEQKKQTRPITASKSAKDLLVVKKHDNQSSPIIVNKQAIKQADVPPQKIEQQFEESNIQESQGQTDHAEIIQNMKLEPVQEQDGDENLLAPDHQIVNFVVKFKQITIESFAMIEMNFVGDLLTLTEVPDTVKQVVNVFLIIIGEHVQLQDQEFWSKACSFLKANERKFPDFLEQLKSKSFTQQELDVICKLIEENPIVINPDAFEEVDALTCALAYLIKDFIVSVKSIV